MPLNPATMLLILIGASKFPKASVLGDAEAFERSYKMVKEYFIDPKGFGLVEENLLDLFNSDINSSAILEKICNWLSEKLETDKEGKIVTDLFIYYIGHGGFKDNTRDYYLAISSTNQKGQGLYWTSLQMEALAQVVRENARLVRRYIILDACFAASAASNFQGSCEAVLKERIDSLAWSDNKNPGRGTALLCASSAHDPAKSGSDCTRFSGALLKVLRSGTKQYPRHLNLRELHNATAEQIKQDYGETVNPELHSPDQRDGDIANIPIFPNMYYQNSNTLAKRIWWPLDGKVMVLIEKGEESFYIDECPVTKDQFDNAGSGTLNVPGNLEEARQRDNGNPKVSVSPEAACRYAQKIYKQLPTAKQWHYLIQMDQENYDNDGNYKDQLECYRLTPVRKCGPQHKEQLWSLVGNVYEIVQDDEDPKKFYRVSSSYTSVGRLQAFNKVPICSAYNTIGFRTVASQEDITQLVKSRQLQVIRLEDGKHEEHQI